MCGKLLSMKLSKEQNMVMNSAGHLLVTGGPGSGKTTISIQKAAKIVECNLLSQQTVLFLSFARASVSRVLETLENEQNIPSEVKGRIKIETYHSFFWRIIKTHGYLIGLPRRLDIMTPPNEAIALSAIRRRYSALNEQEKKIKLRPLEEKKQHKLAMKQGTVCFDLFAPFVNELLNGSKRLQRLLAIMHPFIILDEFQDTNPNQWGVVSALGISGHLIALADPEQRIFDFIGADPKRLEHFRNTFSPTEINFGTANYRSVGTEITNFGNDIVSGNFQKKSYKGIYLVHYYPSSTRAMLALLNTTKEALKRLTTSDNKKWSLAILVPTKRLTRQVSDNLRKPIDGTKPITHNAILEFEAVILASEIIAYLLQQDFTDGYNDVFVNLICNYFQGKKGNKPTKGALDKAKQIRQSYQDLCLSVKEKKNIKKNSIINKILAINKNAHAIKLTGAPDKDWLAMRSLMENGTSIPLKEVGNELRNFRLLERGEQLRQDLSQDWLNNGSYTNALAIVRQALAQNYLSMNTNLENGVVVMNMHKSKGKQFDEVIIFEKWPFSRKGEYINYDRIVRYNKRSEINDSSKQNFRVSVTRSRQRTTILTPKNNPCVLLCPKITTPNQN